MPITWLWSYTVYKPEEMHREYYDYFKITFIQKLREVPKHYSGEPEDAYSRLVKVGDLHYTLDLADNDEEAKKVSYEQIYHLSKVYGLNIRIYTDDNWKSEYRKIKISNIS
jgi:hypothetical protein